MIVVPCLFSATPRVNSVIIGSNSDITIAIAHKVRLIVVISVFVIQEFIDMQQRIVEVIWLYVVITQL
jgi:hypothetical protein